MLILNNDQIIKILISNYLEIRTHISFKKSEGNSFFNKFSIIYNSKIASHKPEVMMQQMLPGDMSSNKKGRFLLFIPILNKQYYKYL